MAFVIVSLILVVGALLILVVTPKIEKGVDLRVKPADEYIKQLRSHFSVRKAVTALVIIVVSIGSIIFIKVGFSIIRFLGFLCDHIFLILGLLCLFLGPMIYKVLSRDG